MKEDKDRFDGLPDLSNYGVIEDRNHVPTLNASCHEAVFLFPYDRAALQ